jgi:hypothetical protein
MIQLRENIKKIQGLMPFYPSMILSLPSARFCRPAAKYKNPALLYLRELWQGSILRGTADLVWLLKIPGCRESLNFAVS